MDEIDIERLGDLSRLKSKAEISGRQSAPDRPGGFQRPRAAQGEVLDAFGDGKGPGAFELGTRPQSPEDADKGQPR